VSVFCGRGILDFEVAFGLVLVVADTIVLGVDLRRLDGWNRGVFSFVNDEKGRLEGWVSGVAGGEDG
jgi:hypothetical protein